MRTFRKHLFLLLPVTFVLGLAEAQTPSKDSAIVKKIGQLSRMFELSGTQEAAFLSLERQHVKSTDSVGKLFLSPEQRKEWLTGHLREHDRVLKEIMTAGQWDSYTRMLQDHRDAFMKLAEEKKIKPDSIDRVH